MQRFIKIGVIMSLMMTAGQVRADKPGPTLSEQLEEKAKEAGAKTPAQKKAVMDAATEELRRQDLGSRAAKLGSMLPDFALPDARGKIVKSSDLLAKGPVVVTFYRGGWCPYCNLQLRAYQKTLPEIIKRGAQLVAISPESPDESLSTTQKDNLGFTVLSDQGNALADQLGLVFKVPADLKAIYLEFGIDLEKKQGNKDWRLPLPATFVVGQDGKIVWRFVDVDYKKRAEPADILKALDGVNAASRRK